MNRLSVITIVWLSMVFVGCAPILIPDIPQIGPINEYKYVFCNRDADVLSVKGCDVASGCLMELSVFNCQEIIDNPELRTYKRFRKRPDEVMMRQFNLSSRNMYNDYDGPVIHKLWFVVVEQRTSECVSLSITADRVLYGRPAGSNLSDKFIILANDEEYLFSYDKRRLYRNCEITIDEYLAMRPMVLPVMKLSMSEVPEEQLPMEVTFTIDIGLSGGRHLVNDICINMK